MKPWLKEHRGFILFLCAFGLMRTAVADWNPIPSGSMRPALVEGDVVLVNRVAFDLKVPLTAVSLARLGEPQRGDVVTFFSPHDGTRLIKRIVALPGDVVSLQGGVLVVNDEAAHFSQPERVADERLQHDDPASVTETVRVRESVAGHARQVQFLPALLPHHQDMPARTVPDDHFFMLGDNRDNSVDSRFYGLVPRHLLIGRAHHLVLSWDSQALRLRVARTGQALQ